jgi:ubiquinone/menaquinone biosynthesis C-methylase UbiE
MSTNLDARTVEGFGEEWSSFDQSTLSEAELKKLFEQYFSVFPWDQLPPQAIGFDLGCGSGRWAKCVAPKVGILHCIDASSEALQVARRNLTELRNCFFHEASVDQIPLADNSADFGYSLGVLHHIPDTFAGLQSCVSKLKAGAPFLVYLYYAFDNRPFWFRCIWKMSDLIRVIISRLPYAARNFVSQVIAAVIYYPLARTALLVEKCGWKNVESLPLAPYRYRSFYSMRTDALDRFGTRLEHRFTAAEILTMMERAGLEKVVFSQSVPYWCAVGFKRGA